MITINLQSGAATSRVHEGSFGAAIDVVDAYL